MSQLTHAATIPGPCPYANCRSHKVYKSSALMDNRYTGPATSILQLETHVIKIQKSFAKAKTRCYKKFGTKQMLFR